MTWGFGLLLTASLVVFGSKFRFELTGTRFLAFSASLLAAWPLSKIGLTVIWSDVGVSAWKAMSQSWFEWAAIVPFGAAALIISKSKWSEETSTRAVFGAAALCGAITFGSFNPFQRAFPIFDVRDTPFLAEVRQKALQNPNGWTVMPGMYGALFSGAGVPAINRTLTAPQLEDFSAAYFRLCQSRSSIRFSTKYAHIRPTEGGQPHVAQADVIVVPVEPFLSAIPALAKERSLTARNEYDAADNQEQGRAEKNAAQAPRKARNPAAGTSTKASELNVKAIESGTVRSACTHAIVEMR